MVGDVVVPSAQSLIFRFQFLGVQKLFFQEKALALFLLPRPFLTLHILKASVQDEIAKGKQKGQQEDQRRPDGHQSVQDRTQDYREPDQSYGACTQKGEKTFRKEAARSAITVSERWYKRRPAKLVLLLPAAE